MGVDPKKYRYHSDKNKNADSNGVDDSGDIQNPILQTETEKSLKHRSIAELKVKCPFCQASYDFPGIFQEDTSSLKNKVASQLLSGLNCL